MTFDRNRARTLLLVALLVPGCAGPPGSAEPGASSPAADSTSPDSTLASPPLDAQPVPISVAGCNQFHYFQLRERSDLQDLLPTGYRVASAEQALLTLALPVAPPTLDQDYGAFFLDTIQCSRSSVNGTELTYTASTLLVVIDDPRLAPDGLAPSGSQHVYVVDHFAAEPEWNALWNRPDWEMRVPFEATVTTGTLPGLGPATAEARVNGELLASFSVVGVLGEVDYTIAPYIYWLDRGENVTLAVAERMQAMFSAGPAIACSINPHSVYATAIGGTDCANKPALVFVSMGAHYDGTVRPLPKGGQGTPPSETGKSP